MDDIDIHTKACRAYAKFVSHHRGVYFQPNANLSDWDPIARNVYVLRNINGVLAAYKLDPKRNRLRRVNVKEADA